MISAAKRKQLEESGYSVSKSGKTVTKGKGTVAGINENGKVFGSGKAFDILKGSDSSAPTESKKPKARSTSTKSPSSSSSAPTESKRPKQRQTGRGKGLYEMGRRAIEQPDYDEPVESTMGGPRRGRKPMPTRDRREGTTLLRSPDRKPAEGVTAKRERAKEVLSERRANEATTKAKQDSAPTFSSYMNEKRKENPEAFREDPSGFTQKMRDMYNTTFGFNKGGMVRKGGTSYKDKGMFYKSASPRGYK